MDSTREMARDLVQYLPSFLIPGLISLISIPLFTRYVRPDEWGIYILVVNATELLTVIAVAWLSVSSVRFYSKTMQSNESRFYESTVVGSAALSVGLASVLVMALIFIFRELLEKKDLLTIVFLGVWIFTFRSSLMVVGSVLRAKRKALHYSVSICWQHISRLGFGLIFILFFGWGIKGILFGTAIGLVFGVLVFGKFALPIKSIKTNHFSRSLARSMFFFGLPIIGGDLSFWFLRFFDRYILGFFKGSSEVGIYAVGVDISSKSLSLIVSALALSSWPLVVQVWEKKGENATAQFLTQLMRLYLIVCVPAMVGISLLRRPVLEVLAEESYFEAYKIIPFIAASTFLFGFQRWFQLVLALREKTYLIFLSVISGAFINCILNILLAKTGGYNVVAINHLIGYMIFTLLIVLFSRKLLAWKFPFVSAIKVFASALLMSIVIIIVLKFNMSYLQSLSIGVAAGFITYSGGLLAVREFSSKNLKQLYGYFMKKNSNSELDVNDH